MPLRLAEIVIPTASADALETLLREQSADVVARAQLAGDCERIDTLCQADETERILDALEDRFGDQEGFRVVLVAVEAVLPRPVHEAPEEDAPDDSSRRTSPSPRSPCAPRSRSPT